jgi:asparagine synthase (glutamine-hydrolysing)
MNEIFESDNGLIGQEGWNDIINSLKAEDELKDSKEQIALEVSILVEKAIKDRINNDEPIGIFFSGGLDSSYIAALCKKHDVKFTCYTVGFQDGNMDEPEDVIHAKAVAKHLKLTDEQFKYKIFDTDDAEKIIVQTINILKKKNLLRSEGNINAAVNVGVASVEAAAYSISKKEKFFFSGIGSEEIFAGYERHKNNPTNNECYEGLIKMYERDILRDSSMANTLGFRFLTPFLDEALIKYALRIPIRLKINTDGSKIILRNAAIKELGKYSERPKKAAQYGSSFDKALSRIAKLNNFQTKLEYIRSI